MPLHKISKFHSLALVLIEILLAISDISYSQVVIKDIFLHSLKGTLAGIIRIACYNQYLAITDFVIDDFHCN